MQRDLDQVTLQDLYSRLGRLEEGQAETNEHVGQLAASVGELCASLNGPSHIKERVRRLESWRNRIIGGVLVLSFLATSAAGLSALAVLVK